MRNNVLGIPGTNPNNKSNYIDSINRIDYDLDGIYDDLENYIYYTNPESSDSDNDGLNDYDEINTCTYGEDGNECTDPMIADSDGDILLDGFEVNTHNSDPKDGDSDDDGLEDYSEFLTDLDEKIYLDSSSHMSLNSFIVFEKEFTKFFKRFVSYE